MSLHLRRLDSPSEAAASIPQSGPGPEAPAHDICPPLRLQVSLLAPGCGYLRPRPGWHFWEPGPSVGRLIPVDVELERSCSGCAGQGYVPVSLSEVCSGCTGSGIELTDDRDEICGVCDGHGWIQGEVSEQCERCDGTGLELTIAGRRLLRAYGLQLQAFLQRWSGWTRVAASIPVGGGR